jgi:hypothetical protein
MESQRKKLSVLDNDFTVLMATIRGVKATTYKPEAYYGILQRTINLNNSQSKRLVFALNFSDSDFVPTLTIRSAKGQCVHFKVEEWYEFYNELKTMAYELYDSKKTDYSHKVISNGAHSLQAVPLAPMSSTKLVKVLNCSDDYQVAYLGEATIKRLIEMEAGVANLWTLYTEKYQPKIIERYYTLMHTLMEKKHPFHITGHMPENSVKDYYKNTVGHIFNGDIEFCMPQFGREVLLQEIGFEKIYKDFVKFVDVMHKMGCYSSASNKYLHV